MEGPEAGGVEEEVAVFGEIRDLAIGLVRGYRVSWGWWGWEREKQSIGIQEMKGDYFYSGIIFLAARSQARQRYQLAMER